MDEDFQDEDFPEELLQAVQNLKKTVQHLQDGFDPLLSLNRTEIYENMDPLTRWVENDDLFYHS